jgi:hypothetical protein
VILNWEEVLGVVFFRLLVLVDDEPDGSLLSIGELSGSTAGTSLLVVVEESVDSGSESELTDSSTALDDDSLLELFSVEVVAFL